ncbi:GTP-binding protein [Citrobacter sp. Marseille-Q6884]|uniref:GTP-binding protein n=1 Tax=Citrobacter sp. Marseille-Q6884 TaxID=2956786 RepID=UPI0021B4A876|nr:ATP/GTP-binding protein [Citrobacter sp. Marseille-Q6884]
MDEFKILFAGPTGAGKTTAINTVSDVSVVSTEVPRSSLDTESEKSQLIPKNTVTIGIDYGEFSFDDNTRVRLYGVPGQLRFEFLWELIHKGASGTIILFDITSNAFSDEIDFFINRFHEVLLTDKCIIGISKYSDEYSPRVTELLDLMGKYKVDVPVIAVDIRNKEDVLKLLTMLVK